MLGLEAGGAGRCWPPVGNGGVQGALVHNDHVGEGLGLEAEERADTGRLQEVGGCLDWRREEQAGAGRL